MFKKLTPRGDIIGYDNNTLAYIHDIRIYLLFYESHMYNIVTVLNAL